MTAAPVPPTGLSATAQSSSSIQVSWNASTGATSYKVQRAPDASGSPGTWGTAVTITASPYPDSGLTANTRYWYRVAATNSGGDSAYASAVSATTQTAPVLSLSATSLIFSGTAGGANPVAQTVTATNSGGGTLAVPTTGVSYGSGSGWLSTSVSGSAAPYTITVTPNMSGLSAGTYTATASVSSAGATSSPQAVSVTLTVASSGTSTIAEDTGFPAATQVDWSDSPIDLILSTGGTNRLLVVSVNCTWAAAPGLAVSGGGLTWTRAVYGAKGTEASSQIWFAWASSQLTYATITVTPDAAADYFITVDALSGARDPTGLTAGTDYAVATATGLSSPAVVISSVTTKGTSGSWLLGSAALSSGGSSRTYDANNVETSAWITAGDTAMWTVRRNAPLSAGTYSIGTTGPATSYEWSMVAIEALAGSGGSTSPALSLSTTSLTFNGTVGSSNPAAKTITATNSGGGTLAVPTTSVSYGSGSGWLNTSVTGTAAPYTITVTPSISGLSAGTYTATVSVSSTGASNSPRSVNVTLTVASTASATLRGNGLAVEAAIRNNTTTNTLTTNSWTPLSGSLLVAFSISSDSLPISVSGGGLTWTEQQALRRSVSDADSIRCYTAQVGSSTSSMAVTVTLDVNGAQFIGVYEVTGTGLSVGAATSAAKSAGSAERLTITPQASGAVLLTALTSGNGAVGFTALSGTALDYTSNPWGTYGFGHNANACTAGVGYEMGATAPTDASGVIGIIEIKAP